MNFREIIQIEIWLKFQLLECFCSQNPELLEEWQEGTGGGTVYEAYGQSETVSRILGNKLWSDWGIFACKGFWVTNAFW